MANQISQFYDDIYGAPALAKFVEVGKRRGNSPEHTMAAAKMIYEMNIENPFSNPRTMGHLVHTTAKRLQRQRTDIELEVLELVKTALNKRTFKDKFNNWMRFGTWQ